MGSLTQAQDGAQAKEYYERSHCWKGAKGSAHCEPSVHAKGGVFYDSEARNTATLRAGNEVERVRGIVDRAAKAEAKKERKVFIYAIIFLRC